MSRKCCRCHKIITGDHYYSNERSPLNSFYCSIECAMMDAGIVRHEMTKTKDVFTQEPNNTKLPTFTVQALLDALNNCYQKTSDVYFKISKDCYLPVGNITFESACVGTLLSKKQVIITPLRDDAKIEINHFRPFKPRNDFIGFYIQSNE